MKIRYRLNFLNCKTENFSQAVINAIENKTFFLEEHAKLAQLQYKEDFEMSFSIIEFQEDEEAA